ncbi:hypothetical protein C9I57_08715 [Trinickia symbiotica]|uniref:Uncharacterized protein n=1 Tax=Trinickia symbiotica TaxID=863227 RepID=A0A2T3XWC4_9BURK|nr:hypothetical protein C9I57_08715 [Trinickia symbiotica]
MQSVPGGRTAQKHDRHFANPSVGWANYPPKKPVAEALPPSARLKRIPAGASAMRLAADSIWRAAPDGAARLTAFISVSALHSRTPMNSPLRSARPDRCAAGSGF